MDRDCPWPGVSLGVVDGDLDVQVAVIGAAVTLDDLAGLGECAAFHVEPAEILEMRRFHDQRVAFPMADRISVPPWFGILWQGPAIGEDLPYSAVGFVQNHDHVRGLNHLSRLAVVMELHHSERKAVRVGIVSAVGGDALLVQLRGPGLERETVLESGAEIPERAGSDRERNDLRPPGWLR